jgi:hypothetical protein
VIITDDGSLTFITPQSTIGGVIAPFNSWAVAAGVITSVVYLSIGFDLPLDQLAFVGFTPSAVGTLVDGLPTPPESRVGIVEFTPVPEPVSFLLSGLGLVGIGFLLKGSNF